MTQESQDFKINYLVKVTKAAVRQGLKLPVTPKERLGVIKEMKLLKYWKENEANYDYESAFGAIEFKFDLYGKRWIRVIVFQDDERKFMWVIRTFAKKSNQIGRVDQIGIETAVAQVKAETEKYKREQKYMQAKNKFEPLTVGQKNE